MRKFITIAMAVLLLFGFVSCDPAVEPDGDKEIAGSELQKLIDEAESGETINLEAAVYKLTEPLVINKPLKIVGAMDGSDRASVLDYSGQLFETDSFSDLTRHSWLGGVNIYSDGVTLENVKIVGDLDKAKAAGAVADGYYTADTESSRNTNYKPVFGLFIDTLSPDADGGTQPTTISTTDGIVVRNVEITKTTRDAVYITYVRVKKDWYCKSEAEVADIADNEAKGLLLDGMYIHDNGDIKATHALCNGVFMRNSTGITLQNSKIDTGESGAPVWIHASMYRGPYKVDNTEMKGRYLDSEDYSFAYYSDADAGEFENIEAPVVIEVNGEHSGSVSLAKCINNSAENGKEGNPIQIEDYGLNSSYQVDFSSVADRKPRWGFHMIAIGK